MIYILAPVAVILWLLVLWGFWTLSRPGRPHTLMEAFGVTVLILIALFVTALTMAWRAL